MARESLLIGQVAAQSGVSRKALRLYEAEGILPPPRRTTAGYRIYGAETLSILTFVTRARRLGFRLDEIRGIVQMRRTGRCPCPHVLKLVRGKLADLDRTLTDLTELRRGLHELLESSGASRRGSAAVCHRIERRTLLKGRR